MVVAIDPLDEVLARLTNVSRRGDYWIASSPTREDRNPSMTIRRGDKGILIKDFGGATFEELLDAMGMEAGDLFYEDAGAKRAWLDRLDRPKRAKREYKRPEIPADASFREGTVRWFGNRGIEPQTLEHFRIYSSPSHFFPRKAECNTAAICFPYFLNGVPINVKYRSVGLRRDGKEVKDFAMEKEAEPIFYHLDGVQQGAREVVIAEGEPDVMALWQCGIGNAISPPNGCESITDDVIASGEWFLADPDVRITLAGDMDEAGRKMQDAFAARIGKERCSRVTWPADCKDANDTLVKHGPDRVRQCVMEAEPIPVDGIIRVRDIRDSIYTLYREGMPRGISTGIPALDDNYTIKLGYWTAVTAAPGGGKSNLLDMIATNTVEAGSMRYGIASFENRDLARHAANIMPKHARKPFGAGKTERIDEDELDAYIGWMDEHFQFIQPESPTIESVLKAAKSMVFWHGINGLVIDPWNRLLHPPNGLTNGDYIARVLSQISDFAYHHNCHVWLVAHPVKLVKNVTSGQYPVPTLYDISGSAHFYNMCDFGFALWRDRKDFAKPVEFHCQKSRFQEIATEGVVRLGYDPVTTRYYDLAADGSNETTMWRPPTLMDRIYADQPDYAALQAGEVEAEDAEMDDPHDPIFDAILGGG
jgi:twinkle protein